MLLLDAQIPFEKQDLTLADLVEREGRAMVIAVNKWDLIEDKNKALTELREQLERYLPQLKGVPLVTISGLQGRNIDKLMAAIFAIEAKWNSHVSTARLNRWLAGMTESHPPPAVSGRRLKLLGAAQATLDEMLEYSRTRHAFGRPIGEFQSLAHAMADLQTEIDSARLLTYRAAWLLAQGLPCSREGAMAKLKGSETYVAAARLGMQVLAGHGFSTESVMSFRYRESIVATISGGTSQIQRNGIARSMGLRTY